MVQIFTWYAPIRYFIAFVLVCCFAQYIHGNTVSTNTHSFFKTTVKKLESEVIRSIVTNPKFIKSFPNEVVDLIKNNNPETEEFPFSTMPMDDCPDIEIIDLRNVAGYPQINDLSVCGSADTLSMIIFTGDAGDIKGFEFEIDFPLSLIHI